MPELQPAYSTSPVLNAVDCIEHGFFGMHGGVSGGIYRSLNCGYSSADRRENVTENRQRVARCFGLKRHALHSLKQAHTSRVVTLNQNSGPRFDVVADGMVSATAGVGLGVLGADCAPVLFVDPVHRVIGAAHSGWKGALTGINEAVLEAMCELGAKPCDIQAAIGPAMQVQHYEVKVDFEHQFIAESMIDSSDYFEHKSGKIYFNTSEYIRARLQLAGVANIDVSREDTFSQAQKYYSYRRACKQGDKDYGRQISVIMLNQVKP